MSRPAAGRWRMRFRTPVRRCALPAPLLAFCLVLAGCGAVETARPDIAVSISGEQIPYADFESFLRTQLADRELDLDDAALSGLFEQFLEGQLLTRLAEERGLIDGPINQRRAVNFLLRDLRFEPREASLRAYFAAHRADFARPEEVRISLILVDDLEIAEQARAALAGEDFSTVAARFSQGPTAHLGGDQGLLAREDLPATFAEILFALDEGEVSDIIKADYGYQIFQVTERHAATDMPFEEALPIIRRELLSRHIDEQLASLLNEARERYNVRIFRGNLPFDYRSSYATGSEERDDENRDANNQN